MTLHASTLVTAPGLVIYGLASTIALAAAILKAGLEQPDYFAAAAWLTNNNACFLVLLNFEGFVLLLSGRILQCIFFGEIRRSEGEQFVERLWFPLFDMFFMLSTFPIDFDLRYVFLASVLKFFELFQILCEIRINHMGQIPVLPRGFHTRMLALLTWLGVSASMLTALIAAVTIQHPGPRGFMVYMTSLAILQVIQWGALVAKYSCECYELVLDEEWHTKSRYIFFIDLVSELLIFLTYPVCYGVAIYLNDSKVTFLPALNVYRDTILLSISLFKKLRELIRFRAATQDMETKYPSVSEAELEELSDRTCIICREELVSQQGSATNNATPKKLLCGHIFHFRCLHSWLERQQSCPTCRRSVLDASHPPEPRRNDAAPQPTEQEVEPAQAPQRPQASLEGLLARFNFAPTPDGQSGRSQEPTTFASPSEAARTLLSHPRLDPRTVQGAGTGSDASRAVGPSATATAPQPSTNANEHGKECTEDPREAVRRATLARFERAKSEAPSAATASSAHQEAPLSNASSGPALRPVPPFDPATVLESDGGSMEPYFRIPDPVASQAPTKQPPSIDTPLLEQLQHIQDTQILLQRSIDRLSEAIHLSHEKGKAREPSSE